jgi:hypothetical protein
MVATPDKLRLSQKPKPCLRNMGSNTKNRSDGNTNQNICFDRSAICDTAAPSIWSQIKANNDVSGRDATSAASPVFRLAISAIATITMAEIIILSA